MLLLALVMVLPGGPMAWAQEEEVPLTATTEASGDELARLDWRLRAGQDALRMGFPALAKGVFSEILETQAAPEWMREQARMGLVSASIGVRELDYARELLSGVDWRQRNAEWHLRSGLVAFFRGRENLARRELQRVREDELAPQDRPWRLILQGLLAEREGGLDEAERLFEQARQQAVNSVQAAQFETIILRHRIVAGEASEELAEQLREKVLANQGRSLGLQFAREYAVVLDQLERTEEALKVVESQIRLIAPAQVEEINEMRMLEALLAGPDTSRGRTALRQVLRNAGERSRQRSALYLLASHSEDREQRENFRKFLDELIAAGTHPIEDDLLLLRGRLALEAGDYAVAEASGRALRERFPGSQLRQEATRLLAHLARQQEQYRIAAGYLGDLRAALPDGPERSRMGRLAADCYFLNTDYENASELYGVVLREGYLPAGDLLRMQVLADVLGGGLESAARHLDAARERGDIAPEDLWRAEWALLRKLRQQGRTADAFARLRSLLEGRNLGERDAELSLRLRWMQAQLAFEAGAHGDAAELAGALLATLERGPESPPLTELERAVQSRALLIAGQAQMELGQMENALALFEQLRAEYPEAEAAAQSYLVEARHYSARNQTVQAQRLLQQLAEAFPDSEYATVALFEAAVNAEARGVAASLAQANEILKTLIREYPDAPLVFYARLKQGDLARQLNDFGTAQSLYELLLQNYPNHPERYRVEMALADTLLAQASRDDSLASPALAAFERLFDLPGLPLDARAEAGFKWGFLLAEVGNVQRAREVYWMVISRYLGEEGRVAELQEEGRYWLSRSLFELAVLFEAAGDREQAVSVYEMVLNNALPGGALAQARIQQLSGAEAPATEG